MISLSVNKISCYCQSFYSELSRACCKFLTLSSLLMTINFLQTGSITLSMSEEPDLSHSLFLSVDLGGLGLHFKGQTD